MIMGEKLFIGENFRVFSLILDSLVMYCVHQLWFLVDFICFSEGQDGDSNDIEDGPTATNGDNEDDEEEEEGDDDESSLSSEDSDVAVVRELFIFLLQ